MPIKIRTFLALPMPEKVRKKVGVLVQELQQKAPEIAWIPPENLHITVCFFGEILESVLREEMVPVLEPIIASYAPFALECEGIGVFPNWKYPRVIWAGISGETDRLMTLHEQVLRALAPFKLKRDRRAFRPHLTIGRADNIRKDSQAVQLVERLGLIEFGHIPVKELTIYRSELTKEGAIYTPIQTMSLAKKGVTSA